MRVRCLENDNMEWMRIELSIEDGLNIHGELPNNPNSGLDVTAEIMHNSFLSNMPHLEEVNNTHKSIISEISDTIKSEKISSRSNKSLDLFLEDVGGILDNSKIKIPLSTRFPTEIIVETSRNKGNNLVRIMSPEVFGGMIETFKIGENQKISNGKWINDYLELQIE